MKRLSNLILIFIFSLSVANAQPGSIDLTFQTNFNFKQEEALNAVDIQSDGKIIIGGNFFLNEQLIDNILRLNKDGDLDTNFNVINHYDHEVSDIIIQPNGKVLVAGRNINYSYNEFNKISRLNTNNSWDTDFYPKISPEQIHIIKYQLDNKILIGFIESDGTHKLLRINNDGTIDKSFGSGIFNARIHSISIQANGKILISGFFTKFDEQDCPSFIRLNSDGSLDATFTVNKYWDNFFANKIITFPNGKLLVGGSFNFNGIGTPIIRLNEDGSWDTTFKILSLFDNQCNIKAIHVQHDGKIILGGRFLTSNWDRNIVRLNGNGTLDKSFKTGDGLNRPVEFILPQGENKIIVVGEFDTCNQFSFNRIVRLNIKDESLLNVFILPNPSSGYFKISASQSLKLITITDAVGKEILRTEPMAFETEIDISDKSPGLYFVTAFSNSGSKCQKILKR